MEASMKKLSPVLLLLVCQQNSTPTPERLSSLLRDFYRQKPLNSGLNGLLSTRVDATTCKPFAANHYSGEGNTSRCIAVAEHLRETLHYKNNKSLQFSSTFLDKLQKMLNIFEEEGKEIIAQTKVRMLSQQKIEHPLLWDDVRTLRVCAQLDGSISFIKCANNTFVPYRV
jgi:hypothetical protein